MMLDSFLVGKLAHRGWRLAMSAFLCGVIMGLVSTFSIVAGVMTANAVINKMLYSLCFCGLLFLTLVNGYELFTGNTMLLVLVHKKEHTKNVLLNVLLVYFGNFAGCLVAALAIWGAGVDTAFNLSGYLQKIYEAKTTMAIPKMLLLGVLANYLVCMGVYLGVQGKQKDYMNAFMGLVFPIAMFVMLGFEHSVANMFSLFYAAFVTGSNIGGAFVNLFFVTIGNIAGGVLFALSTKVKRAAG